MFTARAGSSSLALDVTLVLAFRLDVHALQELGTLLGKLGLKATIGGCFLHRKQRQHELGLHPLEWHRSTPDAPSEFRSSLGGAEYLWIGLLRWSCISFSRRYGPSTQNLVEHGSPIERQNKRCFSKSDDTAL